MTTSSSPQTKTDEATALQSVRLPWRWLVGSVGVLVAAVLVAMAVGPAGLSPSAIAIQLLNYLPGVHLDGGLSELESAVLWELRAPRVVLAMLVGAMLAVAPW